MIVAVPSKGRPGKCKTIDFMPDAVLFVPEVEAEAYRKCFPKTEVIGVPQEVRGITRTRNWILDNVDDPDIVMVDDDLMVCGWTECLPENGKMRKMKADEARAAFARLFEVTRDLGYRIWGVATQAALRSIYPYKPFLWQSYITASCMGICGESGIRFDENFPVKEDYEIGLRCVKEDGGIVAARFMYWQNEHWTTAGGCKDYRTQEMEADCIARLMKMYPGMIRRVERGGSGFSIDLDF